jgi:hypothetical protein
MFQARIFLAENLPSKELSDPLFEEKSSKLLFSTIDCSKLLLPVAQEAKWENTIILIQFNSSKLR